MMDRHANKVIMVPKFVLISLGENGSLRIGRGIRGELHVEFKMFKNANLIKAFFLKPSCFSHPALVPLCLLAPLSPAPPLWRPQGPRPAHCAGRCCPLPAFSPVSGLSVCVSSLTTLLPFSSHSLSFFIMVKYT